MKLNKFSITILLLIILSITAYGFVNTILILPNPTTQLTPQQRIIGIWLRENDPTDKLEFLSNGQMKRYFDNVIQYTDTYAISNECGGFISGDERLFLKEVDGKDGTEDCSIINGINEDNNGILSLTTSNQGKTIIYVKQ